MFGFLKKKHVYEVHAKGNASFQGSRDISFDTTRPQEFKKGSIAHQEHGVNYRVTSVKKTRRMSRF